MTDNRLFIVILAIILLGVLGMIGGRAVLPALDQESRPAQPPLTVPVSPSVSPTASPTTRMATETPEPSPTATESRLETGEAEQSPTPSVTGRQASPSPSLSPTAISEPDATPTGKDLAEAHSMYLGMGDTLLFQGDGFTFEARLTTSEEFRDNYAAAYSSIYIDRAVQGNVNLFLHSSTWAGNPNPGEILVRAYTGGALKRGDTLRWKNRNTGEALTLIFVGAMMGIPEGEFEQFHELPRYLRAQIGRAFMDNHPQSRAARLIEEGEVLTIVTCDSRPGHMEIREDGSVAFPEQAGFVFVYY